MCVTVDWIRAGERERESERAREKMKMKARGVAKNHELVGRAVCASSELQGFNTARKLLHNTQRNPTKRGRERGKETERERGREREREGERERERFVGNIWESPVPKGKRVSSKREEYYI